MTVMKAAPHATCGREGIRPRDLNASDKYDDYCDVISWPRMSLHVITCETHEKQICSHMTGYDGLRLSYDGM